MSGQAGVGGDRSRKWEEVFCFFFFLFCICMMEKNGGVGGGRGHKGDPDEDV